MGGATVSERGGGRDVTLHDVARAAGVAVSTASRALSNPQRVSAATRDHVARVAAGLGYRPNRIAQALPSGRLQMLALLVPDITNPHNFGLIRGAESRAREAGYTLIIGDTRGEPEFEHAHAERLRSIVDGFVLASSRLSDEDLRALRRRRPVVLFNREAPAFDSVVTDSVGGSRQIIEHLAGLGHRSIGYLAGPTNAWTEGQRWRALSRFGRAAQVHVVRCGPFAATLEGGAGAVDAALASGASAVVAFNDLMAIGALQELERRAREVPRQLSVVGYDDIFGADFCQPPLTTVASPVEEAGRSLIDLLLAPGAGTPARVVLPTRLRVRASTGPVSSGPVSSGPVSSDPVSSGAVPSSLAPSS